MSKYKLTYFNMRARGELCRLLFAAGDVEYEDIRVNFQDWNKQYKHNTPLGQLPLLEIDGVVYPQSLAIARYLAKQFGLIGDSPLKNLQCGVIVDTCMDLRASYTRKIHLAHHRERNQEQEAEARRQLHEEGLPKFMPAFERYLADYGHDSGYMVGNKMTWADIAVYDIIDECLKFEPDMLTDYPKLTKHRTLVESNSNIKAYLENRPADIAFK